MLARGKSLIFIVVLFIPLLVIPTNRGTIYNSNNTMLAPTPEDTPVSLGNPSLPRTNQIFENYANKFSIAQSDINGILDPVSIEQQGYYASGNISARTDNGLNTGTNLSLDSAHNWVADLAEVSVWNLEKLYAVNGSFDEGIPGTNVFPSGDVSYHPVGWDANSTDTATYADDVQIAAYDSSGRQYITVESQGGKEGQNAFGHVAGTEILWTQEMVNAPYTEDFVLSFDYFYLRGPIDGPGVNPLTGNCSIALFINGTNVWNMSLLLLSQRGVWFETGDIPITIPSAPSAMLFEIGLVIDESLILDKRYDYDGDAENLPDGIDNSAYITVFMDDISFIKSVAPTPEEVDLEFTTGGVFSPLTGSLGIYNASITNTSYWTISPIPVEVVSNTSVSFDYEARLLAHRFTDSNWRTDISDYGVSYTVQHGISPSLTFYSYVGYLGGYEEPQMIIRFPKDWENATISDPFLIDLTGSCTIMGGNISVPSSILDRLGWWQIELESPNYAKAIEIQKYDSSTGWEAATTYRVGNETRPSVEIGTLLETPSTLSNVNISWYMPNGTIWFYESASGGIDGAINGTSKILDNSLAGQWQIEYIWCNGTEVAYQVGHFEVYHSSTLTSLDTIIETEVGDIITGRVRFLDGDNGNYLMENAIIKANWSGSALAFDPNPTRKWWEVDLDTSVVGAGLFLVKVNATLPYYDLAFCEFSVLATNVTRLTSPNSPWTSAAWEDIATLTFNYQRYDSISTVWVPVTNTTNDVVATVNWTLGEWAISESGVAGIYELTINTAVKPVGDYLLNVSFSKPAHQTKQLVLALVVTPQVSTLNIFNGTSAQLDIADTFVLKMNYTDSGGHYVEGATIVVDQVTPSSGLSISTIDPVSGELGNYSLSITINGIGVYTIRFLASKDGYQSAASVFILVVNDVPTDLSVTSGATAQIDLSDTFTATYHFEMFNGSPIVGAQLSVLYSGPAGGLSWNAPVDEGSGDYSIQFDSTISGAYLITVASVKPYFQSDAVSFFLSVNEISTNFVVLNGTADTIDFGQTYHLVLYYSNVTPYGLAGATVEIVTISPSSGLQSSSITDEGNGLYSLTLDPHQVEIFTLVIRANLTNHQTQVTSFTLNVNDIITSLEIKTGISAEIGLTDTFEAIAYYEMFNGTGVENANINVYYSGPSGLSWTPPSDEGLGNYSLVFSATTSGTYLVTITASKTDHQTASSYFFLLIGDITTHLDVLNGTSKTIEYGQTCRLVLSYYNTSYTGLEGANLSIISVTPSIGLALGAFVEEGNGFYSIILDPQVDDTFTLLFSANLTNHQTQFATFTLVSNPVSTELMILNSTTSLAVIQNFTLYLRYETGSAVGIPGATLEISTSPVGLTLSEFEDVGNGYYRIYIFPTQTGSFQFTVSGSKQFYQTESASVFLVVNEIASELLMLNGTSETILFGESFNLVVLFKNSSAYGLQGASLSFISISPSGLSTTPFLDEGEGIYSTTLSPTKSRTFSILIKANLTNHEVKYGSYILVVEPISTVLKAMNSTETISVDSNYNLTLRFEDGYGNGISGALVETINTPDGIAISFIQDIGLGYYRIHLDPSGVDVFNLLFKASRENHQNASVAYILEVSLIPTVIYFEGDITSGSTLFGEEFNIHAFFHRTDTTMNVTSAVVNATSSEEALIFIIEDLGEGYRIGVKAYELGIHVINVLISKDNHESHIARFTLTVQEIPTVLLWENVPEEISFNQTHIMTFSYLFDGNDSGISDHSIQVVGSKANWVSIEQIDVGTYELTIRANEIGTFSLSFQFSGAGLEDQNFALTFSVVTIRVDVRLISESISLEGLTYNIIVDLVQAGTNISITNAVLSCRLDYPDSLWTIMSEISPGRYGGNILLPSVDATTSYEILFYLDKANHNLLPLSLSLVVNNDVGQDIMRVVTYGGSSGGLLLVLLIGLRMSRTRKRKRNLKAIAIKQRFDDVKNMIGIIILHKKSGLPIYSKTLKGGFDESMVSAFITAVSHFRSEFGMDEKHWDFQVIPISDIISAVPTRNLICAFISGSSPSKEQMIKMEAFGRAVGAMFDEYAAIAPTHVLDEESEGLFTSLFMDMMDGEFLTAYKKREAARIPRSMSCLSTVVGRMEGDEFTLDELARGMAMCGMEEGEAYIQVMDAIENDLIAPANGSKPIDLTPKDRDYKSHETESDSLEPSEDDSLESLEADSIESIEDDSLKPPDDESLNPHDEDSMKPPVDDTFEPLDESLKPPDEEDFEPLDDSLEPPDDDSPEYDLNE
ncbi:MAG: carboxypeptidase-like regulatory domain-containing protein [Candidatus Thorarchaeota archaeon]